MTKNKRSTESTDYMDMKLVADYLGMKYGTFTAYVYRGSAPEPDLFVRRSRYWTKATIDAWQASRQKPKKEENSDGS